MRLGVVEQAEHKRHNSSWKLHFRRSQSSAGFYAQRDQYSIHVSMMQVPVLGRNLWRGLGASGACLTLKPLI